MRTRRLTRWERPILVATLAAAILGPSASAASADQGAGEDADGLVEVVVTVGTRVRTRTVADTAVPVDVFRGDEVRRVNSSDLVDVLNTLIPSYGVRREPISDGASFIRPAHLRGLDSHHTLVLVDGKRRHRAALMRLGAFGAHGADVGSLPAIAVDSVEVLRDGAAAQYGTDAIAGVVNFRLRTEPSGLEVRAKAGRFAEGDGREATIEANVGLAVGAAGFVNISLQRSDAEPTSRSAHYDIAIGESGLTPHEATRSTSVVDGVSYHGPDAFAYTYSPSGTILQVLPGSDGVPDDRDTRFADNFAGVGGERDFAHPAQIWGQPAREQYAVVVNAALPVASAELYGFATHAAKDQTGGFFYRRPGVSQLLPVRLADGAIYDPREHLYPSGFTPQFSGEVIDHALQAGVRGVAASGITFDLSASRGVDEIRYRIANTMNPSMGPDTPTSFRPGNLVNHETAFNADFAWPWNAGPADPINIAFGLEYRREAYRIEAGNPASYEVGPFARPDPFDFEVTQAEVDASRDDELTHIECRIPGFEAVGSLCPTGDPVNNTVPIGSNGFPGYPPGFSSELTRRSRAAYVDVEGDVTPRWLANLAVRHERFSDFGEVAIWKLATRYRLTDDANLRGSVGTGFRAPTPGQLATTNVSTRIDPDGFPRAEGVFPPTHPAAGLFGGARLQPERSRSWTLGVTATPFERFTTTFDYYRIQLDGRIVLSSQFAVGPAEAATLETLGVPGANDIAQVRFFTNDVDTETDGVDLVASWRFGSALGDTSLQAAVNVNKTRILDRGRFVDAEAQYDAENGVPRTRAIITANHLAGRFEWQLRARYYGTYRNTLDSSLETIQTFGREVMVDLSASRTWGRGASVTAGMENIFDNYPDPGEFEVCCGRIYRSDSIPPWQGRLLYLQADWSTR